MVDLAARLLAALLAPWHGVVRPGEKMYWMHLLASLALALVVQLAAGTRATPIFSRALWMHRSSRIDLRWYFVNGAVVALILVPLVAFQHVAGTWIAGRLSGAFGARESVTPGLGVAALAAVGTALVADFALFLPHWLQHRIPLLWQFHKVHHSAEVLTPFTAYRFHPVDDVSNALSASLFVGAFDGVLLWLFPSTVVQLTILQANAVFFLFYVSGVHLRHSHVWLSYPRSLSRWLVSPAMHQIHHSADPAHHGKNLGLVFSFWDRLFGTLYVPETRLALTFGLGDGEEREFSNVRQLYVLPFRKALGILQGRPAAAPARPGLDGS